jgi:hypothetical protein
LQWYFEEDRYSAVINYRSDPDFANLLLVCKHMHEDPEPRVHAARQAVKASMLDSKAVPDHSVLKVLSISRFIINADGFLPQALFNKYLKPIRSAIRSVVIGISCLYQDDMYAKLLWTKKDEDARTPFCRPLLRLPTLDEVAVSVPKNLISMLQMHRTRFASFWTWADSRKSGCHTTSVS